MNTEILWRFPGGSVDALLADLRPYISDMATAYTLAHGLVTRGLLAVEAAASDSSHDR